MSTRPVIRGKFIKGGTRKATGSKLSAHLKYAEFRTLGDTETRQDRHLFDQERDHIDRKDAVDDVMAHTTKRVNYHSIILSPADHEHIDDYRQWTRDIMRDLEEKKGLSLHWYAVVQAHDRENVNTPHVHLVLAGTGEDETGKTKMVGMFADDYDFLRTSGREHSNYEFYQQLRQQWNQLDQQDDPTSQQPPTEPVLAEWDR